MAIYQLKTFKDILDAVCEELKVQSSDTVTRNRLKRDINMVYLNEVVPYAQFKWLRGYADIVLNPKLSTGTAAVTQNSKTVTLTSAPVYSVKGHYFSLDTGAERYIIAQHTANSTTLTLETGYAGPTTSAGSYSIWTDKLPLPSDLRETLEVTQDFTAIPLEGVGLQKFRKISNPLPKSEGRPQYYSTSDYINPDPYSTIAGLPALSTRASSGLVKTLVFAGDVSPYLQAGDRIEIAGSSVSSYNGQFTVSSVSTTTLTYTGLETYQESAAADASLAVKVFENTTDDERYRELWVYPSISQTKIVLHVDFLKQALPLENDDDEPLMPVEDRIVLFYGTLMKAWPKQRDPEEGARNATLYDRKLKKMAGNLDDSTDLPMIRPSRVYLGAKRKGNRFRTESSFSPFFGSTGSSSPSGTAGQVAIFNAVTGYLDSSPTVSATELALLDGLTSAIVGISETQTLTNKTIDAALNTISNISNTNIAVGAAIAYGKLALSNSIVNADISAAAAISYSKLNLATSIVNADISASAAIDFSKLATLSSGNLLVGSAGNVATSVAVTGDVTISNAGVTAIASGVIVNADINASAAIAYSKLNLATSIVNADISASAAIAYSKLALTGAILNADLAGSIAFSKLATLSSGNILVGSVGNVATSVAVTGDVTISNAGVTAIGALKVTNAMLAGSIAYSKLSLTGAILNADLAGSIAYSKLSLTGSILNADLAGSIAYSKLSLSNSILNADINSSAAIAGTKIAPDFGTQDILNTGSIRTGTATALSTNDQLSVLRTDTTNIASSAASFKLTNTLNGAKSGANHLLDLVLDRTITTSQTDTVGNNALRIGRTWNVPAGQTFTQASQAETDTRVLSSSLSGGGALAISNYVKFLIAADSVATGTRKVGLLVSAMSGATNNAVISDGTSFTGNWFLNSASTSASLFSGIVNCSAGVRTIVSTADVSNPPTAAQLTSAFGAPGTVGSGFIGIVNDNAAGHQRIRSMV
jgi:hypothetical protein